MAHSPEGGCASVADREAFRQFYASHAWRRCRESYAKSKGGLCERCLARGLITAGEEVHHKIHLTPESLLDPSVAFNFDNLELLCKPCHQVEHGTKRKRRYEITPTGDVVIPPFRV